MKVGFIGTGNMGNPMAANLVRAGHEVTVHDLRQEAAINLLEMTIQDLLCLIEPCRPLLGRQQLKIEHAGT